jgi:hypothetical protein
MTTLEEEFVTFLDIKEVHEGCSSNAKLWLSGCQHSIQTAQALSSSVA